ncbi:tetratricopeptide repeat protein [Chryseolinea lacunae]|uniref:histidine kinase n=1 Tax=Chryseolinea lacunae TaxID=2801331 RepID=A0ABS1KVT6_9BACT|nr:tetratricopeptide repeat protein [Chryseolinea lacunae]MBL0743550.1 tetratricopeptide repeat protein [Chryseolinea lacunae]
MTAVAQSHVIDSLQRVVALQRHDSLEMEALLDLTNEFMRRDLQQAKAYAREALQLSKTRQSVYGISSAYSYLVTTNQNLGFPDSANTWFSKLEKVTQDNPTYTKVLTQFNTTAGLYYKNQGQYKKAIPYLLSNLKLLTAENENRAGLFLNIGNAYNNLGDFKSAVHYHLQSLSLFEKLQNKRGQSFCLNSLGRDFYSLKQMNRAQEYFERSLKMKIALEDKRGSIPTLMALGDIYTELKQYAVAESYYNRSIQLAQQMQLPGEEVRGLFQKGLFFKTTGNLKEARATLMSGLKLVQRTGDSTITAQVKSELLGLDLLEKKEKTDEQSLLNSLNTVMLSGDRKAQSEAYSQLGEFYSLSKQYDKAYQYLLKFHLLEDSVQGKNVLLQMKQLEEQFESEKKEKEIALLKKDQELHRLEASRQRANVVIIFVVLVSVIIISALLVNRYRVKSRTKRLVEMERMRNAIARDLHDDIGSTLSSINIISQLALQDANGSAPLFQRIAQHSSTMMESMSDIVWSINPNNDTLEQVVSKMKEFASEILDPLEIEYSFTGEDALQGFAMDAAVRKNVFLIFKEAVNNAAKYSAASHIRIAFSKKGHAVQLTITDNGKGFDTTGATSGNGLRNMQERARFLRGTLALASSAQGTEVQLSLPIT